MAGGTAAPQNPVSLPRVPAGDFSCPITSQVPCTPTGLGNSSEVQSYPGYPREYCPSNPGPCSSPFTTVSPSNIHGQDSGVQLSLVRFQTSPFCKERAGVWPECPSQASGWRLAVELAAQAGLSLHRGSFSTKGPSTHSPLTPQLRSGQGKGHVSWRSRLDRNSR